MDFCCFYMRCQKKTQSKTLIIKFVRHFGKKINAKWYEERLRALTRHFRTSQLWINRDSSNETFHRIWYYINRGILCHRLFVICICVGYLRCLSRWWGNAKAWKCGISSVRILRFSFYISNNSVWDCRRWYLQDAHWQSDTRRT